MQWHEHICTDVTKKQYAGFEQLDDEGIILPHEKCYYRWCVTYAYESFFDRQNIPAATEKLTFEAKHLPLSVSVCAQMFLDLKRQSV